MPMKTGKLSFPWQLLLLVLPVVAVFTLRTRSWPDEPGEIPFVKQAAIVWGASLLIGAYDGYYGPGTGTFLMIVFIRLAKLDTRTADTSQGYRAKSPCTLSTSISCGAKDFSCRDARYSS